MDRSQRSGGDGWSDVEQRFFETAPPDVPLQPAAPPTFDDLESFLPERRRRGRQAPKRPTERPTKRQFQTPRDRWTPIRRVAARGIAVALVLLTRLATATRTAAVLTGRRSAVLARELGRRLAAASREGWRQLVEAARDKWLPLVPGRAAARELAARAVRLALGPVIDELPAERSGRGTIVAAVAAIVVVVGLAAGVVTAYVPHLTFIR